MDRIYPTEVQLYRANSSDTEALFWINLCISNGTVSTKIYDKRDDFNFDIVNFPFLDVDVPRRTSYGVYISQLIRFARASSNLNDFSFRNKALTAKLLRQAIVCLFVLRFYGPVNPMGSCRARSVYQTTRLLGRLSPLSC